MKIQHKKSIVGIIFVVVLTVSIILDDLIGHFLTDALINLLIAMATGFLGMFWGLFIATYVPIVVLIDGQLVFAPSFLAMIMGNIFYVLVLHISPGVIEHSIKPFLYLTPMLGAALLKYFVQYFLAIKFLPLVFNITELQQSGVEIAFGANQMLSALVGSIVGVSIVKLYKTFLGNKNEVQSI